jgi:predicted enzyme related to lactoylglutathione lyase
MDSRFETLGDFSWTELLTRDLDGAREFYKELLGWELKDMPMAGGEQYTVIQVRGEGVGGMMAMPSQVPASVPSHWGAYVTVKDVDAVAKKARELGAETIVPPTDIPNVGRFFTFKDPQGAVLSVISYEREMK